MSIQSCQICKNSSSPYFLYREIKGQYFKTKIEMHDYFLRIAKEALNDDAPFMCWFCYFDKTLQNLYETMKNKNFARKRVSKIFEIEGNILHQFSNKYNSFAQNLQNVFSDVEKFQKETNSNSTSQIKLDLFGDLIHKEQFQPQNEVEQIAINQKSLFEKLQDRIQDVQISIISKDISEVISKIYTRALEEQKKIEDQIKEARLFKQQLKEMSRKYIVGGALSESILDNAFSESDAAQILPKIKEIVLKVGNLTFQPYNISPKVLDIFQEQNQEKQLLNNNHHQQDNIDGQQLGKRQRI